MCHKSGLCLNYSTGLCYSTINESCWVCDNFKFDRDALSPAERNRRINLVHYVLLALVRTRTQGLKYLMHQILQADSNCRPGVKYVIGHNFGKCNDAFDRDAWMVLNRLRRFRCKDLHDENHWYIVRMRLGIIEHKLCQSHVQFWFSLTLTQRVNRVADGRCLGGARYFVLVEFLNNYCIQSFKLHSDCRLGLRVIRILNIQRHLFWCTLRSKM